jgi:uncharacterized membrane protein YhfC
VVGGSALATTLLLIRQHSSAHALAFGTGAILVGWIAVEVALLGLTSWLQLLMLTIGLLMIELAGVVYLQTPRREPTVHPTRHAIHTNSHRQADSGASWRIA